MYTIDEYEAASRELGLGERKLRLADEMKLEDCVLSSQGYRIS